jgi:hypothetical protein
MNPHKTVNQLCTWHACSKTLAKSQSWICSCSCRKWFCLLPLLTLIGSKRTLTSSSTKNLQRTDDSLKNNYKITNVSQTSICMLQIFCEDMYMQWNLPWKNYKYFNIKNITGSWPLSIKNMEVSKRTLVKRYLWPGASGSCL